MPINVNGFSCILAGGVRETTNTTGTGNYSLNGAATIEGITYRTFAAAIGDGNRTVYRAQLGSEFEHGIGTITAPSTLSRDSILASSNGGNAVNWGTTDPKDIWCDAAAAIFHSIQSQIDGNDTDISALQTLTAQITKDGSNQYRFDPGANDRLAVMAVNASDAIVAALRISSGGDGRVQVEDASSNIQAVMVGSGGGRFFAGGDEGTGDQIHPILPPSFEALSGATKLVTGIRSDARRVTISVDNLSGNGTDDLELTIGPSGGIDTAGYASLHTGLSSGGAGQSSGPTDAFLLSDSSQAGANYTGRIVLELVDVATNTWHLASRLQRRAVAVSTRLCDGNKALAGPLERFQLQWSGTNLFDAGNVSYLVE